MPAFKKVNPNGRKLKLSESVISEICNCLRAGAYIETASAVAGVAKETLYLWLRKGRHQKGKKSGQIKNDIYGRLIHAVERAMEECVVRDLLVIDRAANPPGIETGTILDKEGKPRAGVPMYVTAVMLKDDKGNQLYDKEGVPLFLKPQLPDWSAAAWRLERRHSKRWSRTENVKQSGSIDLNPEPEPKEEPLDEAKVRAAIDKFDSEN